MNNIDFYPELMRTIGSLENEFDSIPASRKSVLSTLSDYIRKKITSRESVKLVFICTHNSRRSHLSQIWAQTAAIYYGIKGVKCFSGGTEATAFNPRAVKAIMDAGFRVSLIEEGANPLYHVSVSSDIQPIRAFSKIFSDKENPQERFAAIMTCGHADENCPFIPGAEMRIALMYDDPKDFDGTALEEKKYRERTLQIGCEILYAFQALKY
jgi:arsenate reductase (thioredoxin)